MNCGHQCPKRIDQKGPAVPDKEIFNPAGMETPKCGARHSGNHQGAQDVKHQPQKTKQISEDGQAEGKNDVADDYADFGDQCGESSPDERPHADRPSASQTVANPFVQALITSPSPAVP